MAEVFDAVATGASGFERRVAVKRMRADKTDEPAFLRMFLDEARIASRLHHGNIVSVIDYGVADGEPFQVLEYVDGLNMTQLCKTARTRGIPVPAALALHVCAEVAHALEHAHSATDDEGRSLGIVHRDVSPANIMVSRSGDVKLTDFGIALGRDRSEQTEAGVTKGKLAYMAPEQLLGSGVDSRVDIFALGCTLHAILSGRSPLASEHALRDMIAGAGLRLDERIDADIRQIIARCTALAKEDRFSSASHLAVELENACQQRSGVGLRQQLCAWFEQLSPMPRVKPALEELLNLEMVLVSTEGDSATYSARGRDAVAAPTSTSDVVETEKLGIGRLGQTADIDGNDQPRRFPWRRVASGMATIAVIAGAAFWLFLRSNESGDPDNLAQGMVLPDWPIAMAPPSASATPLPNGVSSVPVPAPSARSKAKVPRGDVPPPPGGKVEPSPASPPSADKASRPPPTATGSGVLVIAGKSLKDGEIIVDGVPRGRVPKSMELSTGAHSVEVRFPDGRRLGPTSVTVGVHHTRKKPLYWSG